ncbi:MAG: hypothetical protein WBA93_26225 [Microcoleaceae cyanobacterium]
MSVSHRSIKVLIYDKSYNRNKAKIKVAKVDNKIINCRLDGDRKPKP